MKLMAQAIDDVIQYKNGWLGSSLEESVSKNPACKRDRRTRLMLLPSK